MRKASHSFSPGTSGVVGHKDKSLPRPAKKDGSWEEVARHMRPSEWARANSRGRVDIVKKTKTKWNSCRDQFHREVTEMVRSGEGAPKKRPYIYTEQLRFLRPVMDLRLTVDSLEDPEPQPSPQSDPGGAETPPVFSPEMSPTNLAEEESEGVQRGLAGPGEVNPDDSQRPQSHRRRSAPQASSGITTKEVIDSQVIQYLAQKRAEGREEVLMRGLAPLLQQVPQEKQAACIASITLVLEIDIGLRFLGHVGSFPGLGSVMMFAASISEGNSPSSLALLKVLAK
ncbi:uncharacterized protein LOC122935292 [Bufo gargarizans]|uniref:uncharacterized protein LOC122935292 n=1 Tax=Bufo gargarizans TaxID=30331 RepID=UPI001CF59971|nr:uncharacterized protein LOC122935292 [Bufo gargarizans]